MRATLSTILVSAVLLGGGMSFAGSTGHRAIHRQGKKTLSALFQQELSQAKRKRQNVVVFFTADWCAPCKALKEMLDESQFVKKQVRKGRFLIIDVDEWRGPAHRLIPGVNPRRLPVLVRVDSRGQRIQLCHGTALGLLSEEDTGKNLARLIDGKAPLRPSYESDPAKKRMLLRKQAERRKKKLALAKNPVQVKVLARWPAGPTQWRWILKLTIHNTDQQRRFYAFPVHPGDGLAQKVTTGSYQRIRFREHVRANYYHFHGAASFIVVPVAGGGSVSLNAWQTTSAKSARNLMVWSLNSMTIDGHRIQFDKKVAYQLKIEEANSTQVTQTYNGPINVKLTKARTFTVPLKR
jgi:thiol-disulfide isomerase/thioredoxin